MEVWFLVSAVLVLFFLLDDLIIDLASLFLRLGPSVVQEKLLHTRVKNLGIIVANWKEYEVLPSMVKANAQLLEDQHLHIFLGVYPNDTKTREVAEELARHHKGVHVVVNPLEGPTYKGQMLDEIINGILSYEKEEGLFFDGFIMHDSEDLIDPLSIDMYRDALVSYDFIQVPVLSFDLPWYQFVGGTYLDEFAESHSKDMLVRQKMGAAIPSAGVGTCMKRQLVLFFKDMQGGKLFPNKDLTEDYVLGHLATQYGFKSSFLCQNEVRRPGHSLVATREFFPSEVMASIRQKSRWTLGICFQSWERLRWFGGIAQRYFLWRDRKAALAPLVTLNCFVILILSFFHDFVDQHSLLLLVLNINLSLMGFRLVMRMRWVYFHYGLAQALLCPIRWPLAIFINTSAGFIAIKEFLQMSLFGKEVQWKKTQHRFVNALDFKLTSEEDYKETGA